jgi:hypothetical protein
MADKVKPVKARLEALESRVDRLTTRGLVAETIFATVTAFVIGASPQSLQRELMGELRKRVVAKAEGDIDSQGATSLVLEMDEHIAQLFDQIERIADVYRKSTKNPGK